MAQRLSSKILIATILGIGFGLSWFYLKRVLNLEWIDTYLIHGVMDVVGQAFLRLLKMVVVPLILFSLMLGVLSFKNYQFLGRVSFYTLAFFLLSTVVAASFGLLVGSMVNFSVTHQDVASQAFDLKTQPPSIKSTILNIIPVNPFQSLVEGNTLQIIFIALIFGFLISRQNDLVRSRWEKGLNDLNDLFIRFTLWSMSFAPFAVFALLVKTFSELGWDSFVQLARYFLVLAFLLIFYLFGVYGIFLKWVCRFSPIIFFKKFRSVMLFAFSSSSSNATIPVTLDSLIKDFKIPTSIASLVVPLGATINMNGTSIMQAVATTFIAQIYGVELSFIDYVTVVIMATLATVGTAGVPGVGLITLSMVLQQVQLPLEGIAFIMSVDRLLDMIRTVVNVTGDAVASLWVHQKMSKRGSFTDY
ncbi:MAG: dicarboxylate/amino acid:cation symporter [Bdellovibrionaceae bacterium]|nr:dicarboxylate/amino acid:cation symporter [Pseudobdellovibrionaceae bacterium]